MAQFLVLAARNIETFSDADFAPLLEPEAEQARSLYAQGALREIYGRKDAPGAILIFEAATLAEATALVETLPLVAKGMLDVQIIEFGPYRGFGPRG